jgi:hypothetical protein
MDVQDICPAPGISIGTSTSDLLAAGIETAPDPDPSARQLANVPHTSGQHSHRIETGASADAASTHGGSESNQVPNPAANPKAPSSEPKPPMCSCPSERNLVVCIDGTANQFGLKVLRRRCLFDSCGR